MTESQIRSMLQRGVESLWNRGELHVAHELFDDRFVAHDPFLPDPPFGPEGVVRMVAMFREAFPDLRLAIEAVVTDGEHGAMRWRGEGTHAGPLMGMAPTGRSALVTGTTMFRMRDGKFIENHVHWDALGLVRQLGLDTRL